MIKIHCRLLSAGAVFLSPRLVSFAAVEEKEEHIRRLETETALLENRAKLPKRSSRMPFLETLFEDTAADTVLSAFMESGCAVEEIKEEENEKFHIFHVKGKGSFSQITAAFGIIKAKRDGRRRSFAP